jgi:hypothetical protein
VWLAHLAHAAYEDDFVEAGVEELCGRAATLAAEWQLMPARPSWPGGPSGSGWWHREGHCVFCGSSQTAQNIIEFMYM